ncbi:hypothetical protein FB45DRAFT_896671 [Roridomyces roridus]|uniref:Small ribosomal subunit protein mS41 n=1 Tax=Roridomyces roridus TaxID=1738132 RepID=A0AAD7FUL6_9AGAR|nr:hypothetical protein FB45DRAFT_896671 [Roridomyces roridus]
MNSLLCASRLRSLLPRFSRPLSTRVQPIPDPRVESWDELWSKNGLQLKSAGVGIRDRRYILWCMEKFRSGLPVSEFAHELKPKKPIRGWGPSVQNGKRIRSRRDRTKKRRP